MQLNRHGSISFAQLLLCVFTTLVISACGAKGDLYQTQEPNKPKVEQTQQAQPEIKQDSQSNLPDETTK
ncbi:lipoprotein [Colwellia sp. RSH04]|uniref:LptM family lipoprotein n=1 Tax=Colwellia sp. RSH04 TaxID=2305464 RepID=UPI000E58B113|nr:lipoprotein [Colwellia sp. RSH04]RHW75825.1 hypothetical protein D1094_11955 [Colwellia sp. RSH04]